MNKGGSGKENYDSRLLFSISFGKSSPCFCWQKSRSSSEEIPARGGIECDAKWNGKNHMILMKPE